LDGFFDDLPTRRGFELRRSAGAGWMSFARSRASILPGSAGKSLSRGCARSRRDWRMAIDDATALLGDGGAGGLHARGHPDSATQARSRPIRQSTAMPPTSCG
jgi:hypothetical protein